MTKITKNSFGSVNGKEVFLYTLTNGTSTATVTDYGATWVSFLTPDANGKLDDVILGYDNIEDYTKNGGYLGAVIGRHSNRIANARFELNRTEYKLGDNDNTNNLHGGPNGFDTKIWDVEILEDSEEGQKLKLSIVSPDMDAGYPANLEVSVIYTLTKDNAFVLEYFARPDGDTVVNLTNHVYFNLKGQGNGTIDDHKIKIYADFYTPLGDNACPTGEICKVEGTPFDFKDFHVIGERNSTEGEYFGGTGGYDHNFVLKTREKQMGLAVELLDETSKRRMEVYTNKPGIQLYTGNMLDQVNGKNEAKYDKRSGLCLETQYFPNALDLPHFPTPILRKGELYNFTTVYKFNVDKN